MCMNRMFGAMWEGRRCGLASVLLYVLIAYGAAASFADDLSGSARQGRARRLSAGGTFTVRPDHPRLFVTPERLPMLRHQFGIAGYEGVGSHFGSLSEAYQWLRQITVNQINGGRRDLGALRSYMFFALMEDGNPFFLEAAKQSANTEISRWITSQSPAHEGAILGRSPEIAIYFDWLYNYLSPAARDSIAPYLVDGTETFMDDPARAAVIPWSPTSNYNVYPFSIYGEGYADSLAHEGASEAYYWFTEGYLPATNEIYDGALVHGYGGVRISAMIHTAEILMTATGQNFWDESPFLQNVGMGILSRVRNDGVTADGVGKYNAGEADPEVTMPILAARYGNGSMQTLARLFADDPAAWYGAAASNIINLLLFYDATVPQAPLGQLPLAWSGRRGGTVYMRDIWRLYGQNPETDVHAGFFNGPYIVSGELGAQNHFIIARGQDPLIIHGSDFKENDAYHWFANWFDKTVSYNGLLVVDPSEDYGERRGIPVDNDGGACTPGDEAMGITHYPECNRIASADMRYRGRTSRFEDTPDHCYARGEDAELAYKAGKLSEWTRDFLYVRPGLFFVFDRVQASDSTFAKSVVFHMVNKPTLDGTETQLEGSPFGGVYESTNSAIFHADRGTSRIFGQTVFPTNRKIRRIGGGNPSSLGMRQNHKTFASVTYDPDHSYEFYLGGKNNAPGPDFAGESTLYTLEDRDNRNVSNANPAGDWRIEVASRDKKFRDYFLHVMWATSNTETAMIPVTPIVSQQGNAAGAIVNDTLLVAFAKTEGVTSATFEVLALGGEVDVIFSGLTPGATFDASLDGNLLIIIPGSTFTTSDAGVLQFSMILSGEMTVGYLTPPTNTIAVGAADTVLVKVRNPGAVGIPEVWLECTLKAPGGAVVEHQRSPVASSVTGKFGWLEFNNQGNNLLAGAERTFKARYPFIRSTTGHVFAPGTYQWEYTIWSGGYPGEGGATQIGSIQTRTVTLTSSLDWGASTPLPGVLGAGFSSPIEVSITNSSLGGARLPAVWLDLAILPPGGGTPIETVKLPVISMETAEVGTIDFLDTSEGLDLSSGGNRVFLSAPYPFTTSVTGHTYAPGNYQYRYELWVNGYPNETLTRLDGREQPLAFRVGSAETSPLIIDEDTPPGGFRVQSELFQNPVLTQYADVATLANQPFEEAPTVRISAGSDTTTVSMAPITGELDAYRGRYEFQASGLHTIETRGRGGEGAETTAIRTFMAQEIIPGPSRRIYSVDGTASLVIGAGVVSSPTYFLADVTAAGTAAGARKVYRFGPMRDFSEPLMLDMRYDRQAVEHPDKLTIQRQEGDAWVSLPTQVLTREGLARTRVSRLGDFRMIEDPLATDNRVPDQNRLRMVRPNPFVSSASIEVDVAEDAPVRLTVHNVQGQRVKTLFNNPRVAGRYSFIWDGRGDTGRRVAGGVYFCRLQVASHVETQRLLVLPE